MIDFAGQSGERIVMNNDVVRMLQFRAGKGTLEDKSAVAAGGLSLIRLAKARSLEDFHQIVEAIGPKTQSRPLICVLRT